MFCVYDKRVYNNTWWGSSAESAIVIADARHIDEMDIAKMLLLRNEVHGNQGGVNSFPNMTTNGKRRLNSRRHILRKNFATFSQPSYLIQ